MDAAGRGRQRGRSKRPISLSGRNEGSMEADRSCDEQMAKPGEQKKSKYGSDLIQLKDEMKILKEKLSVAEIESNTYRDDFQQERQDRERAVERYESLQQTLAGFESKIEKYKQENADLAEQLNGARQTIAKQEAELEAAKEEIAVKVAQVKQYQKQVEAYKQQADRSKTRGGDSSDVDQGSNRKRKSDDYIENSSKYFKRSTDSTRGYAAEEIDCDSLPPETRGELFTPKCEIQQLTGASSTYIRRKSSDRFNGADPLMVDSRHMSIPDDPNLKCPVCRAIFKKGEIQMFRLHAQRCSEFMQ